MRGYYAKLIAGVLLALGSASVSFGATPSDAPAFAPAAALDQSGCAIGRSSFLCGDGGFDRVEDGGCSVTCAAGETPKCSPAACVVDEVQPSVCACNATCAAGG